MTEENKPNLMEKIYFVKGMYCASCEILIERELLKIKGIKSVEAKAGKGEVVIEYVGDVPKPKLLNSIFRKENYVFFDEISETKERSKGNNFFVFIISLLLIIGFLYLNKSGFSGLVNVSSKSSLPAFFALGLVAGISSCAALVGGMVLSMSKQWSQIYSDKNSIWEKFQPHLMFNTGRIVSYAFFGALLGALGSKLQISLGFTSLIIIAVSIIMVFLAFQMLGFRTFRKFQFALPKSITRYVADETNFKGRYMPFLMGVSSFFLPCGFTITSQGMALLSGNPVQGGFIMGFFALGTAPALLFIGFSAVKFTSRSNWSAQFSKIAAILILFFAFFNINNQLNVLGLPSLNNIAAKSVPNSNTDGNLISDKDLAAIVDGKQILKMDASASGYTPNYFKVRAGVPVSWEINDKGTSGCTNAVISRSLFEGEIDLTPGQTSIKEFTPLKPGKYKFSCWMGMVSGIIEVIDKNDSNTVSAATNGQGSDINSEAVIPSGAAGCGCGGRR